MNGERLSSAHNHGGSVVFQFVLEPTLQIGITHRVTCRFHRRLPPREEPYDAGERQTEHDEWCQAKEAPSPGFLMM